MTPSDATRRGSRRASRRPGYFGISSYWHYMLSAQSDPMIVALCLAAIDCHLCGRHRWAWVLGGLASLGRPEVWLFLGLYSIWAWRRVPSMRALIAGGIVVLVVLWFGIPALTSRTPFVAASNALGSGRRLRSDRVFGTIGRFLDLNTAVIELTALLAVVLAVVRRDRVTLALAAGVCAWVLVEIAFALHGWPGLGRYMYEPAGVLIVLAGVGVGSVLVDAPRISRVAGWAGIALVAVIVLALVPPALSRARSEHHDIVGQRTRTAEIGKLTGTISRARRGRAFAALWRASDPPRVPDDPGLERCTSTSRRSATSTGRRWRATVRSCCSRRCPRVGGWFRRCISARPGVHRCL